MVREGLGRGTWGLQADPRGPCGPPFYAGLAKVKQEEEKQKINIRQVTA